MSRHVALKQAIPAPRFYAIFLMVLALAIGPHSIKASVESDIPCASNTLVISFQPGVISFPPEIDYGDNEFTLPFQGAEFTIPQLEDNLYQVGVLSFETIAPEWRHLKDVDYYDRHGNRIPLVDFTNTYKIQLDMSHGLNVDEVIEILEGKPGIDYVECDEVGTAFHTPNDSLYSVQWNLNNTEQDWPSDDCVLDVDVNAPEAWDIWDSAGTKIGVMDKGIRADHEDLSAFIDSSLSKSWVDGSEWYESPYDHGTRVAGIAAAGADNDSIGIAGIANLPPTHDDRLIVSLKIIGGPAAGGNQDSVLSSRANDALAHVCGKGVYPKILVVNNSWGLRHYEGCYSYNKTLRNAFRNAFYKDVNLVCASGNGEICTEDPCETPDLCVPYPAAFGDYCLAVAGVGCDGKPLDHRHVGSYIDLAAPGEDIETTDSWYADSYADGVTGTSFAAPHASGAIALLLGRDPNLTNEDCYMLLKTAAAKLDSCPSADDCGSGLLRVDSALAAVTYPEAVIRDSTFAYSADSIAVRSQEFMNVDSLNSASNEWEVFWVHVYELKRQGNLWDTDYAEIHSVWTRGKFSTGWKNLPKYDSKFHAGYTELADWDSVSSKATFRTYAYLVFEDSSETDTLGWFPVHPDSGYRMDYSVQLKYNVQQGGPLDTDVMARPILSFAPERLPSIGNVNLQLGLGLSGRYNLDIYDISGRRVRRVLDAKPLDAGIHLLTWDARDTRGHRVAAGVYFARLRKTDGDGPWPVRTARLVLLR